MARLLTTVAWITLLLLPARAWAEAPLGAILFADADNDRVHDIRDGGDFTFDTAFASFVLLVQDVCVGPGGDLYATESVAGEIQVITDGGSFSGVAPFASGLSVPRGLACSDTQILVAQGGNGTIVDATAGGDLTAEPPWAIGLTGITDLFRDSNGTLWASTSGGEIFDATAGGSLGMVPFVTGAGLLRGMGEYQGRLLVADDTNDTVVDFTDGGPYAGLPVFADVPFARHVLHVPGVGLLAAQVASVVEISSGVPVPFAEGFSEAHHAGLTYVGTCGPVPVSGCRVAAKASLSIVEKKEGREKWKASLKGFDAPTTLGDLGDPLAGNTHYALCVYDAADSLVAEVPIDRAGGALCGPKQKPCWQATGEKGWKYKDKDAGAGGAKKLTAKIGDQGKGKLQVQAGNKASKGQTRLQTDVAAALTGAISARIQVYLSDAACFEASLTNVKKNDAAQFKAKTP